MKKLFVTSLLASAAMSFGQAGRPTGDLIAVQRADEQVGGAVRALSYQSVIAGLGSQVRKTLAEGRIVVVRPPKGKTWQQHRQTLLDSGMFSSVEPDTYVSPCATVNDPSFPNQWHLHEISVQRAWDFTFGGNRIVAVVDGGVDLTHPDLMANLVPGYNVLTSQTQQSGGVVSDVRTNGHGTRIAGVAAAVGNNGIGVSGVGPNLKIMPVRVTDDAAQGIALRSDLLAGAQWAVQNGATAVNVSYTGVENADVEAMGAWIRNQGSFLVWAAGNANTHWDNFDHPNVTVIGGLDRQGNRWVSGLQGSGYGRGVDVWAPCVQVLTTSKGGGYGNAPAGTSFAVPQVAATLALLKDRRPGESASLIERKLLFRARDVGAVGADPRWGYGRLNVGRAIEDLPRKFELEFIPIPAGYGDSNPVSINAHRVMVGTAAESATGLARGWKYSQADGFSWIDPPASGHFFIPSKVTDEGVIVGASHPFPYGSPVPAKFDVNGQYVEYIVPVNWWPEVNSAGLRDMNSSGNAVGGSYVWTGWPSGMFAHIWSSPTTAQYAGWSIGGVNVFYSVNEEGLAVGEHYAGQDNTLGRAIAVDTNTLQGTGFAMWDLYRCELSRVRDNGWTVGYSRSHSFPNYRSAIIGKFGALAYGISLANVRYPGPIPSEGRDISSYGEAVGASEGHAHLWNGISDGRLSTQLLDALPPNVSHLNVVNGINNLGDIIGTGIVTSTGLRRAFYARPIEAYGAGVSLGQLGESPTYIGSIPPALSVTFVDEAGTPYPNANVNLNYSGQTGR